MYSTSSPYSTALLTSLNATAISSIPARNDEEPATLPPLTVNIARKSVRLNRTGKSYPLPSEEMARWLNVLAQQPGQWLASHDFAAFDATLAGCRVERMRKRLPFNLVTLIECKRGKGARLRV